MWGRFMGTLWPSLCWIGNCTIIGRGRMPRHPARHQEQQFGRSTASASFSARWAAGNVQSAESRGIWGSSDMPLTGHTPRATSASFQGSWVRSGICLCSLRDSSGILGEKGITDDRRNDVIISFIRRSLKVTPQHPTAPSYVPLVFQ